MYEEIAKQNGNAQHVACQATRIVRLLHRAMKQASLRNPSPLGSAGINKALHCILQLVFFRAQCSFCFFCFFWRFLVFRVFSLSFLYFPFMVLHFLFSTFSSILCFFCCIPYNFTCFLNFRFVSLHFATMFYNVEILPFPFNWLHVALISLYFVVRDDKQTEKPDSECPPGKVISALHFAQLFLPLFTMFTSLLDMPI